MAMIIVIGWQVYDIARETMGLKEAALQLGLIGLVQFVPLFILTLITGWTADRLDRRWIARAAIALELAVRAGARLVRVARHRPAFAALFAVAALLGVARAFAGPALGALAPNLVPRKILPNAIALSSIAWQSGAIAGPALGGYLYAWAPRRALRRERAAVRRRACRAVRDRPGRARRNHGDPQSLGADGRRACATCAATAWCSARSRLDLFAVLLGGATAMLPVFARDILHAGAGGPRPLARRAGGRRDADRRHSSRSGR